MIPTPNAATTAIITKTVTSAGTTAVRATIAAIRRVTRTAAVITGTEKEGAIWFGQGIRFGLYG